MLRTLFTSLSLLALLSTALGSRGPSAAPPSDPLSGGADLIGTRAPALASGTWINSVPSALSDLKGKVVLIEFWTYGCYNCANTIPTMNRWQSALAGSDFRIIGVHTPEFSREANIRNLKEKMRSFGIRYPVVTDNQYKTWEAYHQQFWPVMYLIDKKGIIRHAHVGEGGYEETERMIKELIAEP